MFVRKYFSDLEQSTASGNMDVNSCLDVNEIEAFGSHVLGLSVLCFYLMCRVKSVGRINLLFCVVHWRFSRAWLC